jgi:hypothetical protein
MSSTLRLADQETQFHATHADGAGGGAFHASSSIVK